MKVSNTLLEIFCLNYLFNQVGAVQFQKIGQQVITSINQPMKLTNLFNTRRIWFKMTMNTSATSSANITFRDYFAGIWLGLKQLQIQIGSDTPFQIDGQTLAYYSWLCSGFAPFSNYQLSGTVASPLNQTSYLCLDASLVHSGRPIDALISRMDGVNIYFTPFAATSDVYSNSGGVINSVTIEVVQEMELLLGSNPTYRGAQKFLKLTGLTLTASGNEQDIKFSVPNGQRVASVSLLTGSAGSQGLVTPVDGITNITLNLGGVKPVDHIDPNYIRAKARYSRMFGFGQFDAFPSASVAGQTLGLTGFFSVGMTDPNDPVQLGQYLLVDQQADNKFTVDANSSGTYGLVMVESFAGQPTSPKRVA